MKKIFTSFALLSLLLLTACGDDKKSTTVNAEEENNKTVEVAKEETAPITIPERIEKIVIDELGKANNMKKDTIKDIQYVESDKGAIISLNASDNLSTNFIKKGTWKNSIKVLKPLSGIEDLDIIILHWYFPLVDTYGNEKDEMVMAFQMNRETMDEINWDNFMTDNLPDVVENYFEHAVFKE